MQSSVIRARTTPSRLAVGTALRVSSLILDVDRPVIRGRGACSTAGRPRLAFAVCQLAADRVIHGPLRDPPDEQTDKARTQPALNTACQTVCVGGLSFDDPRAIDGRKSRAVPGSPAYVRRHASPSVRFAVKLFATVVNLTARARVDGLSFYRRAVGAS